MLKIDKIENVVELWKLDAVNQEIIVVSCALYFLYQLLIAAGDFCLHWYNKGKAVEAVLEHLQTWMQFQVGIWRIFCHPISAQNTCVNTKWRLWKALFLSILDTQHDYLWLDSYKHSMITFDRTVKNLRKFLVFVTLVTSLNQCSGSGASDKRQTWWQTTHL